jgi:hypothetical protein
MNYTAKQKFEFNRQIDELLVTVRRLKLNETEIFNVFNLIPDKQAGIMIMALLLVRLEKAEATLEGLRKDGLAF